MRAQYGLFISMMTVALLQGVYYYPLLPDVVASHFGAAGYPNGWSSKQAFLGIYATMLGLILLVFVAVPTQLGRLPVAWISLPHKDYWLAPEQRRETIWRMAGQMLWFGSATLVLMIATFELAMRANLVNPPRLSTFAMWVLLVLYGVYTLGWLIRLLLGFRKPV